MRGFSDQADIRGGAKPVPGCIALQKHRPWFPGPQVARGGRLGSDQRVEGVAAICLGGDGFFILNAVQMKLADRAEEVVWESHWASLTILVGTP